MTSSHIADWFAGRLPSWFDGPAHIDVDREEILVVGTLPLDADSDVTEAYAEGRVKRFRETTREDRMRIADEAEARFGRKVAWGAAYADHRFLFTTLSVPVMTRLRQPERKVLDTLVAAGVARSRSDALGWCVRWVGQHEEEWITQLRDALIEVERLRAEGPPSRTA